MTCMFSLQDINWQKIKALWTLEEREWMNIQEWAMSDDDYGCSSTEKFSNFGMWKDEQNKSKAAEKGKGAHS